MKIIFDLPDGLTVNDLPALKKIIMEFAKKHGKSSSQFPGITDYARQLGVRREHLWLVLTGQRESRSLRARYHALTGRAS